MLSPQVPLNWKLLIESFNLILHEVNPVYDPALPALPLDKDVLCSLACGPVLGEGHDGFQVRSRSDHKEAIEDITQVRGRHPT